jgi:S-adenosylmethionine hydrolase
MRSSRSDIRKIHNSYSEVPIGDSVAVFNHLGLLEIAVNGGSPSNGNVGASGLLGIKLDDVIRIEFAQ